MSKIRLGVIILAAGQSKRMGEDDAEKVAHVLADSPSVRAVYNSDYGSGMASSLKVAVSTLSGEIDAFLVCLGDMPLISKETIQQLLDAIEPGGSSIVVPTFGGRRGNPVLWSNGYRCHFSELNDDIGAKPLLKKFEGHVIEVEVSDEGVIRDFDDPASFASDKTS